MEIPLEPKPLPSLSPDVTSATSVPYGRFPTFITAGEGLPQERLLRYVAVEDLTHFNCKDTKHTLGGECIKGEGIRCPRPPSCLHSLCRVSSC